MAISGSFSSSVCGGHYALRVDWSASQNVTNNTSYITCNMYLVNDWGLNIAARTNNSCYIYNSAGSFSSPAISTKGSHYLGTVYKTVDHATDGTRSIEITATFHMNATITNYGYFGDIVASQTVTLDTIPRASVLNVGNGTLGSAQTITATRYSSSFTQSLVWSCGSYNGSITGGTYSAATTVNATSWSFTPAMNLANGAPNGTSVYCEFILYTYSGGTLIGTSTKGVWMAIPESVLPTVGTPTISDANGYYSSYGKYVQSKSALSVTVVASGASSSSIRAYSVTVNGNSYNSKTFTTSVLKTSGTNTMSIAVQDSRGRWSAVKNVTFTVEPYSIPSITSVSVNRCNSDKSANELGEYCKLVASGSISTVNGHNSGTLKYKYKKTSATSYSSEVALSGLSSASPNAIAVDSGSSYDFVISLTDNFTTVTRSAVLSTVPAVLSFNKSGYGLGIGKVSESAGLEVAWNANFNESVNIGNSSKLDRSLQLISNSDGSFFRFHANEGQMWLHNYPKGTLDNTPVVTVSSAGRLTVNKAFYTTGGIVLSSGNIYLDNGDTEQQIWFNDCGSTSHNCYFYKGSSSSTDYVGLWDQQAQTSVWSYRTNGAFRVPVMLYSGNNYLGHTTLANGNFGYAGSASCTYYGTAETIFLGNSVYRVCIRGVFAMANVSTYAFGISKQAIKNCVMNNLGVSSLTSCVFNGAYSTDKYEAYNSSSGIYCGWMVQYGSSFESETDYFRLSRKYTTAGAHGGWSASALYGNSSGQGNYLLNSTFTVTAY